MYFTTSLATAFAGSIAAGLLYRGISSLWHEDQRFETIWHFSRKASNHLDHVRSSFIQGYSVTKLPGHISITFSLVCLWTSEPEANQHTAWTMGTAHAWWVLPWRWKIHILTWYVGSLINVRKNPVQVINQWARQYGSCYSLQLGNQLVIVLSDNEVVRELLVNRGALSASRKEYFIGGQTAMSGRGVIATPQSELW